jgi:hypothetical protein
MSSSSTAITEITMSSGTTHLVHGTAKEVEQLILDASRGSLMQFAWLADAKFGTDLAINPSCVATLRDAG